MINFIKYNILVFTNQEKSYNKKMYEIPKNLERLNTILRLLSENKKLDISELCHILAVSQNTIYRDLRRLEKDNKLIRIKKGAAIYDTDISNMEEYPFYFRLEENKKIKIKISEIAARLIKDNETIFLDASTTCVYLSRNLTKKNINNLTVVTSSPIIAIELLKNKNINILSLGGNINRNNYACYSDLNLKLLDNLNIQKAFFSCNGFSIHKGFTEAIEEEYKFKKVILNLCDNNIMIVDHSKYNKLSTYKFCDFRNIDSLITDISFTKDEADEIKNLGTNLILV